MPHPEAACSLPRGSKCDVSYPHEIVPSVPRFQRRAWRPCPVVVLLGVAIVENLPGSNHWPLVGHTPPLSLSQVVAAMAVLDFQPLESRPVCQALAAPALEVTTAWILGSALRIGS